MLTDTQEREKQIYDHFQEKAQDKGITMQEFCEWLDVAKCNKLSVNGRVEYFIGDTESRFKRMRREFADILIEQKEGKKKRYFIDEPLDESLYQMHIKIKRRINNALGRICLKIQYKQFAPKATNNEVLFCPEYKRVYNGKVYLYGVATDSDGDKYDIVNDCKTSKDFTQIHLDRIVSIEELDRKQFRFVKTFADPNEWQKQFEYVLGVDPILDREPMELLLYVKNTFRARFDKDELSKFVIAEMKSDREAYSLLKLKIKQNKELERKLLSYGGDVLVASPEKVRKIVAKEIKKLNEYYNE